MVEKKPLTALFVAIAILLIIASSLPWGHVATAKGPKPRVPFNLYFGDLHAHTEHSDGTVPPQEIFAAARANDSDFMAITDHHYMLTPEEWALNLQVADAFTSDDFVAIAGYEYFMPGSGEINVFNLAQLPSSTAGNQGPRSQALPNCYDMLGEHPGAVGLWVHPTDYSDNFDDFAHWTETRDQGMGLLEIHNYYSWVWGPPLLDYEASYIMALDKGWHVMPAANTDDHYVDWVASAEAKTVLLAESLTREDLYQAMSANRGYATLDQNLRILYTLNGQIMGSRLSSPASSYSAWVNINDPDRVASDDITLVEIISDGGNVVANLPTSGTTVDWTVTLDAAGARYFWVRVTTASNVSGAEGVTAWTAPVWVAP